MSSSRRGFLAGTAGATLGALAGCLGGGAAGCTIEGEPTVQSLPSPAVGDPNADVTVAVFEDFACPHCATFNRDVVPRFREEFVDGGTVRYEHRDYPLPVHRKWSWQAASAARGVQDEADDETFFEFARDLFENQKRFSRELITRLANDVGAPGCDIQADAVNETYRPVLEADRQAAERMGARGTPAVFVNGEKTGITYDEIAAAVRRATG